MVIFHYFVRFLFVAATLSITSASQAAERPFPSNPSTSSIFVNLKSGSLVVKHIDEISVEEGYVFKVTRTYDSLSSFEGIFGAGWGSEFETYLSIMPEGIIVVHESGNMNRRIFRTSGSRQYDIEQAVDLMVLAVAKDDILQQSIWRHKARLANWRMTKEKIDSRTQELALLKKEQSQRIHRSYKYLQDPDKIDQGTSESLRYVVVESQIEEQKRTAYLRELLLNNFELRSYCWDNLVAKKLVKPIHVEHGTVYYELPNDSQTKQRLYRTNNGFLRVRHDGVDEFDSAGRLIRIGFHNGAFYQVFRDWKGNVTGIIDHNANELRFLLDDSGRVRRVGNTRRYRYIDNRLFDVFDRTGNHFSYSYDHNGQLIAIVSEVGARSVISYGTGVGHGARSFVRSVTGGGITNLFDFRIEYKLGGTHSLSNVTRNLAVKHYEYTTSFRRDGVEYMKTKTISSEKEILQNVEFDDHGRVISNNSDGSTMEFPCSSFRLYKITDRENWC